MALTYNTNIFTRVSKYNKEGEPYGVLVSGKLNQYNQQGYPILDVIDIDWDGAYVNNLNCYIYTTEDLINCLNISYSNFKNYPSSSYLKTTLTTINNNFSYLDNKFTNQYQSTYQYLRKLDELLQNLDVSIDNFKYMTLDNISFFSVRYDEIVDPDTHQITHKGRDYYLFDHTTYQYYPVNDYYVLNHPYEFYYMSAVKNMLLDMQLIEDIQDFIGEITFDEDRQRYTYSGLLERLHNYDIDIENINEEINDVHNLAENAYNYAYESYTYIDQIIINKDNIGYHTSYNIYKPISELTKEELENYLSLNNNKVYTLDGENYNVTTYNAHYDGQYYAHYNSIIGTGIEREIELLDDKMYDNSYILYKLNSKSNSEDYIDLSIYPRNPGSPERTIETTLFLSYIDAYNGTYTKGIITNSALKNSFSYVFDWQILKK